MSDNSYYNSGTRYDLSLRLDEYYFKLCIFIIVQKSTIAPWE